MCKQNSLNSKILTSYKVPSNIEFINELLKKEVANNKHKIIVLDEGEIVGMGTHKELLKTCKVYREIAYSQLSKEELEDE